MKILLFNYRGLIFYHFLIFVQCACNEKHGSCLQLLSLFSACCCPIHPPKNIFSFIFMFQMHPILLSFVLELCHLQNPQLLQSLLLLEHPYLPPLFAIATPSPPSSYICSRRFYTTSTLIILI